MSESPRTRRTSSDQEIDISAPGRAPLSMKSIYQWLLWFLIFLLTFVMVFFFGTSAIWTLLAALGLAAGAFAVGVAWFVIVKRGAFTWMRLAMKPAREFARGDAQAAEHAFANALARARRFGPNDHRRGAMLCELAQFAKNQGRYTEAIALFEESVEILGRDLAREPMDYFIALNNYAICFINLKDHDSAQRILEKVVDLTLATRKREASFTIQAQQIPAIEYVLHLNLAFLFIEMNELAEAKLHLHDSDVLLPALPRRVRATYEVHQIAIWALWLFAMGQFADAEAELAKAKDPDYPACLRLRSRLLLVRQDFAQAEAALRKHQEAEAKKGTLHRPEFLEHVLDHAECQYAQGSHDAAFASLTEARSLVVDFKLPRGVAWLKALQTWIGRAEERGRGELAESLRTEMESMPAPAVNQGIKILEKFRVHRQAQDERSDSWG